MHALRASLIASAIALAIPTMGHAAVMAGWNFDGNASSNATEAPTTIDPAVTVTGATIGSGLANPGDTDGNKSWGIRAFARAASAPTSIAASGSDYIEITLTPTAGNTVTFTTLDYSGRTREAVSTLGTHYFQLYSSTDGFATSSAVGSIFNYGPTGDTNYRTGSVDLSSIPAISAGTTLSLRLYGVYTNSEANQNDFVVAFFGSPTAGVNDIAINGVVPEPAAAALLALSGGAMFLGRRRQA